MSNEHGLTKEEIGDIAIVKEAIPRIETNIGKIFDLLDGPKGIVTEIALNKQSIKRVWWWLGSISTGIILAAIWIIKLALNKV